MSDLYQWLKVVHVVATVIWVGSSFALAILTARLAATHNRSALTAFLDVADRYGMSVVGSTSGFVLLSGLGMAWNANLWRAMWIHIGFAGMVAHWIIGAALIRRASAAMRAAIAAERDDALDAARARMVTLNLVYLTLLVVVIAVMVIKPTAG